MANHKKPGKVISSLAITAVVCSAFISAKFIISGGEPQKTSGSTFMQENKNNAGLNDLDGGSSPIPKKQQDLGTNGQKTDGLVSAESPDNVAIKEDEKEKLPGDATGGRYERQNNVVYENNRYGFRFYLPESWQNFSIIEEQWEGTNDQRIVETGPKILIRHPDWREDNQHQDIPVMVLTSRQWKAFQNGEFNIGAAPVGPSMLGSNSSYVFALPARHNYAFHTGFEEVEEILNNNPLEAFEEIDTGPAADGEQMIQ